MKTNTTASQRQLTVLRQAWDIYEQLRIQPAATWPSLEVVAVTIETSKPLEPKVAWLRANGRHDEGWIRHRSIARTMADVAPEVGNDLAGPPIIGEWAKTGPEDSESIHLRPHAIEKGMLQEWRYQERKLGSADELIGSEIPALRQRIAVFARQSKENRNPPNPDAGSDVPQGQLILIYHVFWGTSKSENPYALRRLFAHFAGTEECEKFDGSRIVIGPGTNS